MAELIISDGSSPNRRIQLHPTGNQIGRYEGRDTDIVINNDTVSGSHAIIHQEADSGDWFIQDLDSTNGTFINGEKLKEAQLIHGAVIWFGDVEARFESGSSSSSKPQVARRTVRRPPPQSTVYEQIRQKIQPAPVEREPQHTPPPSPPPLPPSAVPDALLDKLRKGSGLLRMGGVSGESIVQQLEVVIARLDAAVGEPDPEISRETAADLIGTGGDLREATQDLTGMLETLTRTLDYFDDLIRECAED